MTVDLITRAKRLHKVIASYDFTEPAAVMQALTDEVLRLRKQTAKDRGTIQSLEDEIERMHSVNPEERLSIHARFYRQVAARNRELTRGMAKASSILSDIAAIPPRAFMSSHELKVQVERAKQALTVLDE